MGPKPVVISLLELPVHHMKRDVWRWSLYNLGDNLGGRQGGLLDIMRQELGEETRELDVSILSDNSSS